MRKKYIGYAGFCNDKLATYYDCDYYKGVTRIEVFKTKGCAKKCYEDVRKVAIEQID